MRKDQNTTALKKDLQQEAIFKLLAALETEFAHYSLSLKSKENTYALSLKTLEVKDQLRLFRSQIEGFVQLFDHEATLE